MTNKYHATKAVVHEKTNPLHYFAYGSNMNKQQIQDRCSRPVALAVARLSGYRLDFFGHSSTWDGAMETIVPEPVGELWGVIYQLSPEDRERLDAWQDARQDGTGAYFHYPVEVVDSEEKPHTVLLYRKDSLGEPKKPSREYLDWIVQGARDHGLPSGYIQALKALDSKKADYPVPRPSPGLRQLFPGTTCSECGD